MSKAEVAQRIESAFERAGVRRTPQRFFVLERLLTKPDHATVEELWAALNKRHARASRATVYNTLHALVDAGLVREFTLDGKAARYDANLHRHHHFVCDKCGAVEDIDWIDMPELLGSARAVTDGGNGQALRVLHGSESERRSIRTYEVVLRGECAKCLLNN